MVFHVPEQHRITVAYARYYNIGPDRINSPSLGNNGFFYIPPPGGNVRHGRGLYIQASDAEFVPWEHVSVHAEYIKQSEATRGKGKNRKFTRTRGQWVSVVPNWDEMCRVKDLFWDPEDVAMQVHPRASQYVNNVAYVLHLWRCTDPDHQIPEPPADLVGVPGGAMSKEELQAELDRSVRGKMSSLKQAQRNLQLQEPEMEMVADYKRLHDAAEEVNANEETEKQGD